MNTQQTELHRRFKELVKGVVDSERAKSSDAENKKGLVGAYDNPDYFVQWIESKFSNPDVPYNNWDSYGEWLRDAKQKQKELGSGIDETLNRILKEGFSYLDLESLRYEFPSPEDDTPDESLGR